MTEIGENAALSPTATAPTIATVHMNTRTSQLLADHGQTPQSRSPSKLAPSSLGLDHASNLMVLSSSRYKSSTRGQTGHTLDPSASTSRTMPSIRSHREDSSHWPPRLDDTLETAEDVARKAAEDWEAQQTSEKIDLSISAERSRRKKNKAVKILLLGQSESGKSTTLRNFQLNLAPQAFQADGEAWRTVIHLNLLISVNYLLEVLKESLLPDADDVRQQQQKSPYLFTTPSRQLIEKEKSRLRSIETSAGYPTKSRTNQQRPAYSTELRRLMLSLLPLKSIEQTLRQRLGAEPSVVDPTKTELRDGISSVIKVPKYQQQIKESRDPYARPASAQSSLPGNYNRHLLGFRRHSISSSATSSTSSISSPSSTDPNWHNSGIPSATLAPDSAVLKGRLHHRRNSRLYGLVDSFAVKVRGSTGWRRRARIPDSLSSGRSTSSISIGHDSSQPSSRNPSLDAMSQQEERELQSARQIIQVFGEDIEKLWRNEDVQRLLKRKNIRLENRPGFFLNDVLRITAFDYMPTTSDILRARLQTTGVEEHRLILETGTDAGKEWIIYDVGGFRSQRAAWAPFFDTVNAIIFLAPISAFDEWLVEDPSVNRLEDTFHLWREICANRLIASVEFILFLNKYDALRAKIRSGIRFSDYVVNYDDQDGAQNDAESIVRYMLATFNVAHKKLSPKPRKLRAYLTSVIDSRATSKVVTHISEQVLISNLVKGDIL
ncbi:hypothetical protein ACEPAG_2433 [Sanghuangporus baumii]